MKNLAVCVTALALLLSGCDKPNPNPELLDPVYADLSKKAEEIKKQAEAAKAAVVDAQKEADAAVPQTRQIEYATKRLNEAKIKLLRAEQIARYYEIRTESRVATDKAEYSKAFSQKKPWPDPAEYQQFLDSERLATEHPTKWDANARRKELGFSVKADKKADEKPAEKKAEE